MSRTVHCCCTKETSRNPNCNLSGSVGMFSMIACILRFVSSLISWWPIQLPYLNGALNDLDGRFACFTADAPIRAKRGAIVGKTSFL